MKTYQTVVVIDSLLKNEEIDEIVNKVERVISNNGGKIQSNERWGKKRLAYEIKRRQYGYYVEIIFEAPPNVIHILEREYRLEENILRYLSIHLDKNALEYREKQLQDKEVVKADVETKVESTEDTSDEDKKEEISILEEAETSPVVEPSSEIVENEKEISA
ncbi:30S ribosomal protein S6 [candidate division KSB1 bacterium]|nr:30S ribosomal protein S6 [candidate division KSB1 bacterium]